MKGLIRPFYDRLDIEIPYIWYPIPDTAPGGPCTVFTDRWNDDRDHWWPPGVGVVPHSQKPYFGNLPAPGLRPVQGTPEQWVSGFSYADFIAGRYPVGTGCVPIPYKVVVARVRQAQAVVDVSYILSRVQQAQDLPFSWRIALVVTGEVSQAQDLPYVAAAVDQVAEAQDLPYVAAAVDQVAEAQDLPYVAAAVDQVAEAQDLPSPPLGPPDEFGCVLCPGGTYSNWQVEVSGATGDFAELNGLWALTYVGSCSWTGSIGSGLTASFQFFFSVANLALTGVVSFAEWRITPFDCVNPMTLALFSSSGSGTVQFTVVVNPV